MSTRRCPVLLFTPQVLAWLAAFGQTHRVEVLPSGRLRWVRVAWPVAGGAGDQPALDVAIGDFLADVMGRLAREDAEDRAQRLQLRAARQAAAADRRAARDGMEVSHA